MIWVSGLDKLRSFFNKGWLNFTGRTLGKGTGLRLGSGVHPDDRERCLSTYSSSFDAALTSRWSTACAARTESTDGCWTAVFRASAPDTAFAGYIGSCIDITDLKRAQESCPRPAEAGKPSEFWQVASPMTSTTCWAASWRWRNSRQRNWRRESSPSEELQRIQAVASRGSEIVRELMIYSGQDKADFGANRCIAACGRDDGAD